MGYRRYGGGLSKSVQAETNVKETLKKAARVSYFVNCKRHHFFQNSFSQLLKIFSFFVDITTSRKVVPIVNYSEEFYTLLYLFCFFALVFHILSFLY